MDFNDILGDGFAEQDDSNEEAINQDLMMFGLNT